MKIIAQTPRLIIREFLPEEQEIYLNHFNDELVTRHIPKRTREERSLIFQKALQQYTPTGICGIWGMFNRDNNDFIGSCLLRGFENEPGTLELGYSMDQKHWGNGIGTEMARAMIDYGFLDDDTNTIVGITTLQNIGSQRVLEKAGMKRQENIIRNDEEVAFFNISE